MLYVVNKEEICGSVSVLTVDIDNIKSKMMYTPYSAISYNIVENYNVDRNSYTYDNNEIKLDSLDNIYIVLGKISKLGLVKVGCVEKEKIREYYIPNFKIENSNNECIINKRIITLDDIDNEIIEEIKVLDVLNSGQLLKSLETKDKYTNVEEYSQDIMISGMKKSQNDIDTGNTEIEDNSNIKLDMSNIYDTVLSIMKSGDRITLTMENYKKVRTTIKSILGSNLDMTSSRTIEIISIGERRIVSIVDKDCTDNKNEVIITIIGDDNGKDSIQTIVNKYNVWKRNQFNVR